MAKFRKKPVVVDAWPLPRLLHYAANVWYSLPKQIRDAYEAGEIVFEDRAMTICTLEGRMSALDDDWVICGIEGELYPCKRDIFLATYEMVSPSDGETVLGPEHYAAATELSALPQPAEHKP